VESVPSLGRLAISLTLDRTLLIGCIFMAPDSLSKRFRESLRTLLVVPIFFLILALAPSSRLRLLPRINVIELLREFRIPIPAFNFAFKLRSRVTQSPFDSYTCTQGCQSKRPSPGFECPTVEDYGGQGGRLWHAEPYVIISRMVTDMNHLTYSVMSTGPSAKTSQCNIPWRDSHPKNALSSRSDPAAVGKVFVGTGTLSEG
jgi:hypothetical protein